jgi:hypothetical protein
MTKREKKETNPSIRHLKKAVVELFKNWVAPRIASYEEPSRVGVAKGDPIGFSAKKYLAAQFLALYSRRYFPQAELAQLAGVSHDQYRSWCTEKGFKKVGEETLKEFRKYLARQIIEEDNEEIFESLVFASILLQGLKNIFDLWHRDIEIIKKAINDTPYNTDYNNKLIKNLSFVHLFLSKTIQIVQLNEKGSMREIINKTILPIYYYFIEAVMAIVWNASIGDEVKEVAREMIKEILGFSLQIR